MGYNESYEQKITNIKSLLDNNKQAISGVINNYKNNINDINTKINSITNKNWIDDVETEYSDYIDYLKTGIILKLNNSVDTEEGSLVTFEKLIKDLEEKCNDYLNTITKIQEEYSQVVHFDAINNEFFYEDPNYGLTGYYDETATVNNINASDVTNINTQFSNLVTSIDDILKKLKELRFESVTAYESTKDYDFSKFKKEDNNKKEEKKKDKKGEKKEKKEQSAVYKLPEPKGHKFKSPDNAWILINDNTKTLMERDRDPLTGITSPDTGEHQLWAYNTVSSELVPINDYKFKMGFIESDYIFTLPNGKEIVTNTMEAAFDSVSEHIRKYLPETVQDKWVLRYVDASRENNEELYNQVQTDLKLADTFVASDLLVLYNPITQEEIRTTKANITEEKDKYIIKYADQTYIVYKDNYVKWNFEDLTYYDAPKYEMPK